MTLRVLTLNVWALPFGLARDTAARMDAIGARLGALDADVVALQEVWTASALETLVRAGQRSGHVHAWHRPQRVGGGGLLLLSRRPLHDTTFVPYTAAGLPQRVQHGDYWGGKGFVIVRVDTEGGPVAIVSTHLHAGYVEPGLEDEYVGIRTAQIVELARHLAEIDEPLVLVGDLNCRDDEPEYAVLLGLTGLRDAAALLDRREPTALADSPYRAPDAAAQRIDYVLVRGGLRGGGRRDVVTRDLERVLGEPLSAADAPFAFSDHAGLLAKLEVRAVGPGHSAPGARSPAPSEPALRLARERLALGRSLRAARLRREGSTSAGIGATGAALLALGGATGPRAKEDGAGASPRRDIVRTLLLALGGFGVAAAGAGALAAFFGGRSEAAGYARAERDLATLEAGRRERDTLVAP